MIIKGFRYTPSQVAVIAIIGSFFLFNGFNSIPVSAASDISVSNSGKVSFGKVLASSTGSMVTGEDTLNINTDCEAGANVYATSVNGSSTGTSLINLAAKEQDESSNSGTGVNSASYTITTSSNSISSPGSLENNTWGLNVINNNTYYGLPEYSASGLPTVIYSGTNTELPIYYGAKVTNSLAPGTYTGEVLYTVTVNNSCLDYTVKFDKNTNNASGDMSDQSILPTGGTLSENSFTYSGYAFLGWSLDPAGRTGTATNGIGTAEDVDFADKAPFPGSNESILPGSETTLYAIWEKQTIYMQNWFGCAKMTEGETITLTDSRDGAEYTVKKFGSGSNAECWMTSNLTLGYDQANNVAKGLTLTKDDTNIPDNTTYYLPPAGKRGSVTSSGTVTATNAAVFDSSTAVSEAHVQYRAAGQAGDTSSTGTLFQNTGYYNYPAATLGYSYYNGGASSGDTPRDICPAGWQLPRGSSTSTYSFYWLDTTLGGTGTDRTDTTTRDKFLNDASFGYSGYYDSSRLYNIGSSGSWWSSTLYSSAYAYNMYLSSNGYVYPQLNYSNKYRGFSVRCIAKQSYTINYNANGGTGEMAPSKGYIGSGTTLSRNTFTKDGYYFAGWSTDPSATSPTYPDGATVSTDLAPAGGSVTLYAVWSDTPVCSSTVHPTTTEPCRMADNKLWIFGNNGNPITWTGMFTNATGVDGHDATLNSGICPSGYSAPKSTEFDTLIQAYGGTSHSNNRNGYKETTGVIYSTLGLPSSRFFWSSAEYNSSVAYLLDVYSTASYSSNTNAKSNSNYVLCYKT